MEQTTHFFPYKYSKKCSFPVFQLFGVPPFGSSLLGFAPKYPKISIIPQKITITKIAHPAGSGSRVAAPTIWAKPLKIKTSPSLQRKTENKKFTKKILHHKKKTQPYKIFTI